MNRPTHNPGLNITVLWIVMGVVVIVMFLGLLGLIAWATGAFEGSRSRAAVDHGKAEFLSLDSSGERQPDLTLKTWSHSEGFC